MVPGLPAQCACATRQVRRRARAFTRPRQATGAAALTPTVVPRCRRSPAGPPLAAACRGIAAAPRRAPLSTAESVHQPGGLRKFMEDMRRDLHANMECGLLRGCVSPASMTSYVSCAREALTFATFHENVQIFYWLSKCAQSCSVDIDDEMLLAYGASMRFQALSGSESELVRVLRTYFAFLNKNKIARAMDIGLRSHMDIVAHELLTAALPRLCTRHQHLCLKDLGMVLSIYAKMYKEIYAPLFDACVTAASGAALEPRLVHSEATRLDFFIHGPFVLVAYAQAHRAELSVFNAYLNIYEPHLDELTYENTAILAYAVAFARIERPSFWHALTEQIDLYGDRWAMRSLGFIVSACRRILQAAEEQLEAGAGVAISTPSASVERRLLEAAGSHIAARMREMQTPTDKVTKATFDMTFHEAADLAMACALLPSVMLLTASGPPAEMLRCACDISQQSSKEFPPAYLAGAFNALVAIRVGALSHATTITDAAQLTSVDAALVALSTELRTRQCLLDPAHMELMIQALWALSSKATALQTLTKSIDVLGMLRVHQREAIRRARDFGTGALVRVACATAAASFALENECPGELSDGVLSPWFLPGVLDFVVSQHGLEAERVAQNAAQRNPHPRFGADDYLRTQMTIADEQLAWLSAAVEAGATGLPGPALQGLLTSTPHAGDVSSRLLAYKPLEDACLQWTWACENATHGSTQL